jgi:hypothetical protein
MAERDIASADIGDQQGTETKFSVAPVDTDGPTESKETEYINVKWSNQLGFYKKIPELKVVIDAKATWTVGKGVLTDPDTQHFLDSIRGFGKDSFNTFLENMIRVYQISGDSFAEIIRDNDGKPINLKPLDPSTIKIIANKKGLIIRYEQVSKTKQPDKKILTKDMLHFSRNRTADELHGESMIDALEPIITSRNEMMETQRLIARRFAKPIIIWHLDTDDESEIEKFKLKTDKASTQGENFYIPKDAVVPEILSVANNSLINLTPIINSLNNAFFQAAGMAQVLVGGSPDFTEASAKIAYLASEQNVKSDQLYIEEQCGMQLGIIIELEFPASLENELLTDQSKGETMQTSTPEDTSVQGVGLNG